MAAATMALATSIARLSPLTHINFIQNGAVLRLAAPTVSISCTFRSLATRWNCSHLDTRRNCSHLDTRRNCSHLDVLATTFEDPESNDIATEAKSEALATESESEDQAIESQEQQGTKLYVGNLPWSYSSSHLAEIIQEHGDVEVVEVIFDQEQGRSRGFAFVTMATIQDARAVIKALDGSEVGGRVLKVNFPNPSTRNPRIARPTTRGRPGNINKLFVSNFPWSCDDEALTVLFSGYGTVLDAKVVYDMETGRSRGYAFVTLSSAEEVNAALESLNGADYEGRELKVALVHEKRPA